MKASKDSKASAKTGYVMVPEEDWDKYMDMIAEGNALNKKGGDTVNAAVEDLKSVTKHYGNLKYFGVLEGACNFNELELGVGLGFIFKDALIGKVGVEKKNILDMTDWLDWKNAYKATFSLGIVF